MDYPKSVPGVGLVGGQFADEDQVLGRQGSLIPAAWGNAVTEELLNLIRGAGGEPDEDALNQVATLLLRNPTGSLRGMPQKASPLLARGLVDDATMLTPAMLAAALRINPSHTPLSNDTFPMLGKATMKIGTFVAAQGATGSAIYTFPEAFPTALLFVAIFDETVNPATIIPIAVDSTLFARTGFTYRWNGAASTGAGGVSYLAIGY